MGKLILQNLIRHPVRSLLTAGAVFLVVPVVRRLDAVAGLGGLLIGMATAALWEPIVGAESGALLDGLPTRGAAGLALLAGAALMAVHDLGIPHLPQFDVPKGWSF